MQRFFPALLLALLFASAAHAATSAQFATHTVFLSTDAPVAGTPVLVHTSVVNTSPSAFSGEVIFKDGTTELGRVTISLPSGAAQVATISWLPTAGAHTLTATLTDAAGTPIDSSNAAGASETTASFQVAAPPAPKATPTSSVQSSQPVANIVDNTLSIATTTSAPMLSSIDSLRTSLAQTLNAQIVAATKHIQATTTPTATTTAATSTLPAARAASSTPVRATGPLALLTNGFSGAGWLLYRFALTLLKDIVQSTVLFYALFVLVVLIVVRAIFRLFF